MCHVFFLIWLCVLGWPKGVDVCVCGRVAHDLLQGTLPSWEYSSAQCACDACVSCHFLLAGIKTSSPHSYMWPLNRSDKSKIHCMCCIKWNGEGMLGLQEKEIESVSQILCPVSETEPTSMIGSLENNPGISFYPEQTWAKMNHFNKAASLELLAAFLLVDLSAVCSVPSVSMRKQHMWHYCRFVVTGWDTHLSAVSPHYSSFFECYHGIIGLTLRNEQQQAGKSSLFITPVPCLEGLNH